MPFVALGNSKASSFLALLRKIILRIPFIYIMPHFFDDKVFAIFLAEPAADFIAVAATVALFSREFRRLTHAMRERQAERSAWLDTSGASSYKLLWKREGSLPRARLDKTRQAARLDECVDCLDIQGSVVRGGVFFMILYFFKAWGNFHGP